MKKTLAISLLASTLLACSQVPPGEVGIKVNLLGSSKGVDNEILTTGKYWIGFNEQLYLFPTFTQTYVFTKSSTEGSPSNEEITFQTKEGISVASDIGLTYHIHPEKVAIIFQKYRKGIDEITHSFLRSMIRDQFVLIASTMPLEDTYGAGKATLMKTVKDKVQAQVADLGIVIENIYSVGDFRFPEQVTAAINAKIAATQLSQQKNNEIQSEKADAEKLRVKSQGQADAVLIQAKTQAQANKILSDSITPTLIQYQATQRWNGVLPVSTSSSIPMLNLGK